MVQPTESVQHAPNNKLHLMLDLRAVTGILVLIIAGMLLLWKPWMGSGTSDRTVQVRGDATVTAKPDRFAFYPTYQFKNADKNVALAEVTKKSDEVTAKLKGLGVAEKDIKTNSNGYDYPVYFDSGSRDTTYSLQLTVVVASPELAQKAQDYLVTTGPTGEITPQATFSDAKRKALETTARGQATAAARAQADQMAKNLGFTVGKVKSVSDGTGFEVMPLSSPSSLAADSAKTQSLTLHTGENELPYSVTVVYFIR